MACDEFAQRPRPPRGQTQIQGLPHVPRTKPPRPEAPFGLPGERPGASTLPFEQGRSNLAPRNAGLGIGLVRGKTGLQFNLFMLGQLKRAIRRLFGDAVPNVFHKLDALRHWERFISCDRRAHRESIHHHFAATMVSTPKLTKPGRKLAIKPLCLDR